MATIRKNAWKRIESILRSAILIREIRIDDMGGETGSVTPDHVIDCGRKYEFDRCRECDGTATFSIHRNWFFVAYTSIDGARQSLTPHAFEKYFPCLQAGYISVRGGKWHRAVVAEPTFTHDEQTACGLTVRPLNVTWNGERPSYAHPSNFCKHCEDKLPTH